MAGETNASARASFSTALAAMLPWNPRSAQMISMETVRRVEPILWRKPYSSGGRWLRRLVDVGIGTALSLNLGFVALRAGCLLGWIARWIGKPAALPVMAVVVTTVLAVAVVMTPQAVTVVGGFAVAYALVSWTIEARRRMVVEEVTDYVVGDAGTPVKGLATLLLAELDELSALYTESDERRGVSTLTAGDHPLEAALKVDDVAALLRNSVSAEAKVRASGSITVDRVTVTGWRERSDSSTLDASRSL